MSVLPLHWVNSPSIDVIRVRRRIPLVATRSIHDFFDASFSSWSVARICSISPLTNSASGFPSAWLVDDISTHLESAQVPGPRRYLLFDQYGLRFLHPIMTD